MPSRHLQVIADDLSGAAECAAALARAACGQAPLVLKGAFPASGSWAVDTDSRAMPMGEAANLAAQTLRRASAQLQSGNLLFKKIDSTLRGHVAAELGAVLALHDVLQAAVVCPALPAQGRSLKDGMLHVHGEPLVDKNGCPIDLLKLLAPADARSLLVRPSKAMTVTELARKLMEAVDGGTRALVIDASDEEDLRRLAQAIAAVSDRVRLLPVGAAGLAKALATELIDAASEPSMPTHHAAAGPLIAVVGSFSPVTRGQVDALVSEPDVHLTRLDAAAWLDHPQLVAEAMATAQSRSDRGQAIVFAACGTVPADSTRELVRRMAAAADALIRQASTLVLTGGDTARAVLDRLGVERLHVSGELEPGICLSHGGDGSPSVVTKAGAFGDSRSLLRVLRRLRPAHHSKLFLERN